MNYPYWEYNPKKKEITIYFSEHNYVTYYDADSLHKDLKSASDEARKFIYYELYLDYKEQAPYRREGKLL